MHLLSALSIVIFWWAYSSRMADVSSAIKSHVGLSVENILEELGREGEEEDAYESGSEARAQTWLEVALIAKEHQAVVAKMQTKGNKRRKTVVLL
jgi:hypothetical protein